MAKYINLMGYAVEVKSHIFPATDFSVSVKKYTSLAGYEQEIPLFFETMGQILPGIPDPCPDTKYIVPIEVKYACPHRDDLVSPRLKDGKTIGFII